MDAKLELGSELVLGAVRAGAPARERGGGRLSRRGHQAGVLPRERPEKPRPRLPRCGVGLGRTRRGLDGRPRRALACRRSCASMTRRLTSADGRRHRRREGAGEGRLAGLQHGTLSVSAAGPRTHRELHRHRQRGPRLEHHQFADRVFRRVPSSARSTTDTGVSEVERRSMRRKSASIDGSKLIGALERVARMCRVRTCTCRAGGHPEGGARPS